MVVVEVVVVLKVVAVVVVVVVVVEVVEIEIVVAELLAECMLKQLNRSWTFPMKPDGENVAPKAEYF